MNRSTRSLGCRRARAGGRAGSLLRTRALLDARADSRSAARGRGGRSRAPRRQNRHRRRRAAGGPGDGGERRHDRRARSEPGHPAYIGPATRVIDLKGALATPGFIDAHVHFTGVGEAARNLKLATAKNWDDIVRMVGDAAKKARPGEWILGRGWHQEKWSEVPSPNVEGFPLHDALSRVSPNNPVWLTHASGHAGFANALAMKMAEVQQDDAGSGGRQDPERQGRQPDRPVQRARAVAHRRCARPRPRDPHAGAGRSRPAQGDRAGVAGSAVERADHGHDAGSPPATIEVMKKVVDEASCRCASG